LEQQSPTPQRPDDVKPANAAPPPVAADAVQAHQGADAPRSPETADPAAPPAPEAAAPPLTPMGWLQQNSPFLAVVAAVVALLYYNFGFDGVYRACLVAVGLGLVIFVHELGHFLTAKWCNVHVQTFSLGFGPALPGCSYKYGETTYKIGILPLGGYVQMVGEGAEADEDENYPRSYKNKTVLQRMLIISAGVVMNVLLGCVCFIVVYRFHGMPMPPAIVWRVDAGSPAWTAGIPTGARFKEINNDKNPNFETLKEGVALNSWYTGFVHMVYETLGGQTHTVDLRPRHDANDSQPVIGVSPPGKLQLLPQKNPDDYARPAFDNSAAAAARVVDLWYGDVVVRASDPSKEGDAVTDLRHDVEKGTFDAAELCERMRRLGDRDLVLYVVRNAVRAMKGAPEDKLVVPAKGFDFDDVIAATTDPDHPDDVLAVKELRTKAGGDSHQDFDFFDYQERLKRLEGRPMMMQVLRVAKGPNDATTSSRVNVLAPPAFHVTLGMRMKMGEVSAIRDHSAASDKIQPGDKIVAARVTAGGATLLNLPESELDPVRLPYDLERAANRARAGTAVQVVLTVKRWDAHEQKDADVALDWDDGWRFDEELPIGEASAMAVPELGIAYRVESTVVQVEKGSPAEKAGIQPNDRIEEISFKKREKNGPGKWDSWEEMKSDRTKPGAAAEYSYDQWAHYFYVMQSVELPDVRLRVSRAGARLPDMEMTLAPDASWPLEERGVILLSDMTLQKADTFLQAVGMGVDRTWSFIRQMYMGFANILTGRISFVKHARGPLGIAEDTFEAAKDPFQLTLWLGLISVNLAVVNFLPIPILDGGHMVFLLYELVRRRPPSDAVRAVASYVGLAALGLLMLFVIYLDAKRMWSGK